MAHISAGVEYGLHCLLYLVEPRDSERHASARDLADLQGVPAEFVAKLFTKLQKARLVVAAEGAHGGYRLARPAHSISVLDVVVAIDGEKPLFECREIRSRCAIFDGEPPAWATRGACSIHAVMLEAATRTREVLASRSLADIAQSVTSKASASYPKEVMKWLAERTAGQRRATTSSPKSDGELS